MTTPRFFSDVAVVVSGKGAALVPVSETYTLHAANVTLVVMGGVGGGGSWCW